MKDKVVCDFCHECGEHQGDCSKWENGRRICTNCGALTDFKGQTDALRKIFSEMK